MVPLRPLGLGEILAGAFGYIRANPLVTLGVAAVVTAIVQIVQVAGQLFVFSGFDPRGGVAGLTRLGLGSMGFGLALGIVTVIGFAVLSGMLIVVLSRAVLGRPTSLAQAWATARARVPGLIGVSLLAGLIVAAIVVLALVPIFLVVVISGGSNAATGTTAVIVGLLALAAIIYVAVSLTMAAPSYVLEDIGVVAALSRSRALIRGTWWRVFGILIVVGVISFMVTVVISLPFNLLGGGVSALSGLSYGSPGSVALPSASALIIGAIGTIIAGTLTAPFTAGVNGLLYIDQRIRRERFDLDLARSAAAGTTGPTG